MHIIIKSYKVQLTRQTKCLFYVSRYERISEINLSLRIYYREQNGCFQFLDKKITIKNPEYYSQQSLQWNTAYCSSAISVRVPVTLHTCLQPKIPLGPFWPKLRWLLLGNCPTIGSFLLYNILILQLTICSIKQQGIKDLNHLRKVCEINCLVRAKKSDKEKNIGRIIKANILKSVWK